MDPTIVPTGLTVTVQIGGQPYQVPAMTLDVYERTVEAGLALSQAKGFKAALRPSIEVLAIALSDQHPDLTAEVIRKRMLVTESFDWMGRGFRELMRISGLAATDDAPGEAAAVAGETSGSSSTS